MRKIDLKIEDRNTLVFQLKKDLYTLKQDLGAWYGKIYSFLKSLGFTKSKVDSNLYLKVMNDELVMLLLYVDDVSLTKMNKSSSQIAEEARHRVWWKT